MINNVYIDKIIALCLSFIPLFAAFEREVEDIVASLEQKSKKPKTESVVLNGALIMSDLFATPKIHFDVPRQNKELITRFLYPDSLFSDEMVQQTSWK